MRSKDIDDLEDVKMWIAEHDGRIDAFWAAQHRLNDEQQKTNEKFLTRLTAVEKRIMWFSGLAAALGSGAGTLLNAL